MYYAVILDCVLNDNVYKSLSIITLKRFTIFVINVLINFVFECFLTIDLKKKSFLIV